MHPLHDQLILAVDFDGTITTDPLGREPFVARPHAVRVLKKLYDNGVRLILWTCRSGPALDEAKEFLKEQGILHIFSAINEQLPEVEAYYHPYAGRKIGATYYLDDRNLLCGGTVDWLQVEKFFDEKYFNRVENDKNREKYEVKGMNREEQIVALFKAINNDETFLKLIREKFVPFYLNLPYVTPDSEIRRDNVLFAFVFWFLAEIQYHKEGAYKDSWSKRKEIGVFFQVARKFDRLENIMINGANDEVGETVVDTVADLANYAILWMTFILRERPEDFVKWIAENLQNNPFKMEITA